MSRKKTLHVCVWIALAGGWGPVALQAAGPETQPATAPVAPAISFLDVRSAQAAILDDVAQPYFSLLQPAEMSALTGTPITGQTLEEQRAECRNRFRAGVRSFSAREKEAISQLVEDIHHRMRLRYPVFARQSWSFLKLSEQLCGGLPHTRGAHIILPESVCEFMVEAASQEFVPGRHFAIELLVHEQMHVFQRAHPRFFNELYTQILGFEYQPDLEFPAYLIEHQFLNPDGTDYRWVLSFQRGDLTAYILPLLLLHEGDGIRRLPSEIRQMAVFYEKHDDKLEPKLRASGKPTMRLLHRVPEFVDRFGMTFSAYHPDEAGADVFAKLFVADENALREKDADRVDETGWLMDYVGYQPVRDEARRWFEEHLGKTAQAPASKQPGRRPPARARETAH